MGLLQRAGAELTPRAEDAEILVVNTCSFIDSAKQESVDAILEMTRHKVAHGGRAQRLIVAGCLVERYRDEIQKNIPEVDAVVGTGELEAILEGGRPAAAFTCSPHLPLPGPHGHPSRGNLDTCSNGSQRADPPRPLRRPAALPTGERRRPNRLRFRLPARRLRLPP